MTKRERGYHHGDLRRALLDAAQSIVEQSGPAAVTMAAVARRTGVSSGAPYRHFEDLSALMRGLRDRAVEAVSRRMRDAAEGAPDPLEGFRRSGVAYVRFAAEEPALFSVMARGEWSAPGAPGAHDAHGAHDLTDAAYEAELRALLTASDGQAPLDPKHPAIQQLAARCVMHGLAHLFADGQHAALGIDRNQAERLADALSRALGPPALGTAGSGAGPGAGARAGQAGPTPSG